MSDENNSAPAVPCGWVKLWHQAGVLVTLPVPFDMSAMMCAQVDDYLANGFCVEMPNAQAEGESKDTIGWVCLRIFERDGEETPVVDLYADHEKMTFSVLSVYLNTASDRMAFEHASGMLLREMTPYDGAGKLERGAGRTDRYIARAPAPFVVLHKPNPKHDPNETDVKKKKPKRVFSRWADVLPVVGEPKAPSPPTRDEIDPFADDAPHCSSPESTAGRPQQGRMLDTPGTGLTERCPMCNAPAGAKKHATGCRANLGAFQ